MQMNDCERHVASTCKQTSSDDKELLWEDAINKFVFWNAYVVQASIWVSCVVHVLFDTDLIGAFWRQSYSAWLQEYCEMKN